MRVGTLAALLAAAVFVAGCGGSSNSSSGGSSKSSTKSSTMTTKSLPGTGTTTSTPSTASTGTKSNTPPTFASNSNCLALAGVSAKFAQAVESVTGSKFNETAAASDFQQLANAAPSAIRSDLQTVAAAFASFASALKKSGYAFGKTPTATQTAALESAVAVFETPKLKAADAALQAWSVKNCR
jgi:hypothetical protein